MRATLRGLRHSLRGRLLLGTLAWVVVSVLLAGWAMTDLFRQHITRQLAAELAIHQNQLIAAIAQNEQGLTTLRFEPTDPRLQLPYSGLYWQIDRLEPGAAPEAGVFRSRSLWDQTLHLPETTFPLNDGNGLQTLTDPRGLNLLALVRTITPPEGSAIHRLIIAVDEAALTAPMSQFSMMLAIFLGVLALGLTAAAVVQLYVGLRPLSVLRARVGDVRAGKSGHIEGRFPTELQPLVDEFNAVLVSNSEIVQRARTQAGNLAHALKTPLSILANAAAREATPFSQLVSEQVGLAARQVEHHLARARAAAAVQTPGTRSEVLPVLQGLAKALSRLYADKGLHFDLSQVDAACGFRGGREDLQEMLGNLMENACKWAGHEVRLSVSAGAPDTIVLCVEDDGPGLPEDRREAIFQRGVRMDERVPGSGLGLAIVRDLATAYGGSVHAEASALGGLSVVLVLPGG